DAKQILGHAGAHLRPGRTVPAHDLALRTDGEQVVGRRPPQTVEGPAEHLPPADLGASFGIGATERRAADDAAGVAVVDARLAERRRAIALFGAVYLPVTAEARARADVQRAERRAAEPGRVVEARGAAVGAAEIAAVAQLGAVRVDLLIAARVR